MLKDHAPVQKNHDYQRPGASDQKALTPDVQVLLSADDAKVGFILILHLSSTI